MSNGDQQMNCVLEVCCGPHTQEQYEALEAMIEHDLGKGPHKADVIAEWVLKTFDLAPAGSLSAFKAEVARLARL
jgi:hypothetical protein